MKVPLSISFRDVEKTDAIENLIREKASKLEQVCDYMTSCRVAIERPHVTVKNGNPYRVRIDITVPPGHEVVVSKEPGKNSKDQSLPAIIRNSFNAVRRQLEKLVQQQRAEIKNHPEQEIRGIIAKLYKDEGYGFVRTINGRDIYFHRNSVINFNFTSLEEGRGVRFFEQEGEKGPQASTVMVMD